MALDTIRVDHIQRITPRDNTPGNALKANFDLSLYQKGNDDENDDLKIRRMCFFMSDKKAFVTSPSFMVNLKGVGERRIRPVYLPPNINEAATRAVAKVLGFDISNLEVGSSPRREEEDIAEAAI